MSKQQQPQEHCEHECVCDNFHPEYDPDYQEICNNSDCPHDTRSRPHPAPAQQEIRGFVMIDRQRDFSLWLEQHDAAIARKAREESQQCIEQAIVELQKLSKAKWDAAEKTKNITFSYEGIGVDEAIALLQAGDPK